MFKTFKLGGIHPPENKLSADAAVESIMPEGIVSIFLGQHIGAPAEAVVAKGDTVKVGQLIAKASGFVSANIHSSVSGTVSTIDSMLDHQGVRRAVINIKVEGDEWLEDIDRSATLVKEITLDAAAIIKKVNQMGIVGLGGAAFPSHIKLMVPTGKTAECVIINASECEPYLTSDYRVMLESSEEVMVGVQILMKAVGVTKAYIGIEKNKPKAIAILSALEAKYPGISIVPLQTKYPQGGEKQLIKAILNREIPSGGLPIDVGAVVQNVGTAVAVYKAVQKNQPLVENTITLTGKSAQFQKNYSVRVGTPIRYVIDLAGGLPDNVGKVILGGPMMGKAISNLDAPTQKSTSAILFIDDHESQRKDATDCIRCARCVGVCPMALEPYLLIRQYERKMFDELETNAVHDCIECGSCIYTCPANIPLLDYIRLGKAEVMKIKRNRK